MTNLSTQTQHFIHVVSGASYILILISVNLIGYGIGIGNLHLLWIKIISFDGIIALIGSFYILMCGVSLMLYLQSHRLTT